MVILFSKLHLGKRIHSLLIYSQSETHVSETVFH